MAEKDIYRVLVINPGSTSTKIGVFDNETCICEATARHQVEELAPFRAANGSVYAEKDFRRKLVLDLLVGKGIALASLDAAVGRAGRLPPMTGGTYFANDELIKDVPNPLIHAALLGAIIAKEIGEQLTIPAFFVDPTVVDEITDVARVTGIPAIKRSVIFHALNQKEVARRCAKEMGRTYKDCNFIITHLGGGISVAAHRKGVAVDVTNASNGEGPFSVERAGAVPGIDLVEMCFSGKYTQKEMNSFFTNKGGLVAHRGSTDFRALEADYRAGKPEAKLLFEAMAYNIAKYIGAMAPVLEGEVDRIIVTGGLAHCQAFTDLIKERVAFIAEVAVYPGEDELLALAHGALRVLTGEEKAIDYKSKGPIKE